MGHIVGKAIRNVWSPLVLFIIVVFIITQVDIILQKLGLPENWLNTSIKVLSVIAWIFAAMLTVRIIRILFWEGFVQNTIGRRPPRLVMQLGNVFVFFLALTGMMTFTFGQSITAFWTASGAIGIVVGFALRNLILDTFSGLAIHMEQPFKVGDWINCHTRMGDFIGRVEETNWRTTRLWTTSRNMVIIPNSFLTTTVVSNFSMPDGEARFELEFVLDFSVSTDRAIRVLTAAAIQAIGNKGPLADPVPKVRVNGITQYGVEYKLRYYLDPAKTSPSKARNTLVTNIVQHLNHAGLTLSYPKRDLYMAKMPWRQKDWTYHKDQISQLGKLSLFKALSGEDLEFIADKMIVRNYKSGKTVVSQGDAGETMFVLAEGMLEVFVDTDGDQNIKVAELAPGTFFGEKSLLTGEARSATICCSTDAMIGEITKDAMSELFARNRKVAELLSHAVVVRDLHNMDTMTHANEKDQQEALEEKTDIFLNKLKSFFGMSK